MAVGAYPDRPMPQDLVDSTDVKILKAITMKFLVAFCRRLLHVLLLLT